MLTSETSFERDKKDINMKIVQAIIGISGLVLIIHYTHWLVAVGIVLYQISINMDSRS
jgi:hypothetical protein